MPVPLKVVALTAEEKTQLQRLERFDYNWRVRERVKTLLVDNASTHRSKEVTQALRTLELQSIKLYFLPLYSPELNRIEKLWQQMKYVWMDVKSRTIDILNQDVSHILDNFGTDFKLAFLCT